MNAIKVYFLDVLTHHYVDFKGRATRKQFWLWILFGIIAIWVIDFSAMALLPEAAASAVASLVNLAVFLPSLSMAARRLHDTDKSAWWLLLTCCRFSAASCCLCFTSCPARKGKTASAPITNFAWQHRFPVWGSGVFFP